MVTLCLNLFQYSPYLGASRDVPTLLQAARQADFGLVGLDVYTANAEVERGRPLRDLRTLLDDHGVRCFEVLGLDVGADDDAALDMAGTAAALVAATGADYVLTIVSAPVDTALVDRFARCADVVGEAGGRLALEFMPFAAVSSIDSAVQLCGDVGFERAKVLLDTWHFFRGPDGWPELDAMPVDAIGYVQFDDARPLVGDDLPAEVMTRRTMPGEGEFDLPEFCTRVKGKGYTGVVSVEVLATELQAMEPDEFARRAMASSAPYWA